MKNDPTELPKVDPGVLDFLDEMEEFTDEESGLPPAFTPEDVYIDYGGEG